MEKNYSDKNSSNKKEGPSDLTVKRILAFSKAFKTMNDSKQDISKELKK
ncbi:MAG: hypothetical protein ACPH4I_01880 [Flavobacteriaceae bacterium]